MAVSDQRKKKIEIVQETDLNKRLEIKGLVRVDLKKLTRSLAQGVLIVDMEIQNLSKEILKSGDLKFGVSANGKVSQVVTSASKLDQIPSDGKSDLRLVTRLPEGPSIQLTVSLKGKSVKAPLSQGRPK